MNKKEVEEELTKACKLLYDELPELIVNCTNERTICSHIARFLKPLFENWDIDTEYNREGKKGKPKRGASGKLLLPDIAIHTRGAIEGPNLVANQVKGSWNKEDRTKDEEKLKDLQRRYKYKFLYRFELSLNSFEIIPVHP